MPKNRFDAEEEGMDIIIDCTGVPGNIGWNLYTNIFVFLEKIWQYLKFRAKTVSSGKWALNLHYDTYQKKNENIVV